MQKGEMTQEEFKRNIEHTVPFLVPVPLTSAVITPCTPLGQVMSTNDRALGSFAGCASVCLLCYFHLWWLLTHLLFRTRVQLVSQGLLISTKVM